MKKIIFLITSILTTAMILSACSNLEVKNSDEKGEIPEEKDVFNVEDESEETLSDIGSHKVTVESGEGEITAPDGEVLATYGYSYPVFECNEGDNEEYIAKINQMFKDNALGVASGAEAEYETLLKEYEYSKEVHGKWYGPYVYRCGYTIHTNAKGIISITETWYAYLGGAHGMHVNDSHTLDVVNGKELSLSDLLYGTEDGIVEAFAKEFVKVSDMFYPGDDPAEVVTKEFPYAEYYVDSEGVTAYFQEYHVGPYSSGFVSATISDKEMLKYDFSDTTN